MGDPLWHYKVLGLHMDGTNGSTTFTDVKGNTVTANGNAQISTAQYPALTGKTSSGYFDGTGDYLTVPDNANFELGAGDFCIRFRVRFSAYPSNYAGEYYNTVVAKDLATSRGFNVQFIGTSTSYTTMRFNGFSNNTTGEQINGSNSFSLNTWYAIEVSRVGTLVYLFVDGTLLNSGGTSFTTTIQNTTCTLDIGYHGYDGTTYLGYLNGYLSEVEIYKGVGINTSSYAPSSNPFPDEYVSVSGTTKDASGNFASRLVRVYRRDTGALVQQLNSNATTGAYKVIAANSGTPTPLKHYAICHDAWGPVKRVLGLHMDGTNGSTTFTDVKGKTVTANGNAQISTAQYPALTGKTSSGLFDGTGDYLTVPDSTDFAFGSGDFTIKCRFKQTATGGTYTLLAQRTTTTSSYSFAFQITGSTITFICSTSGTATTHTATASYTQETTNWHDATAVRSGSNITVSVDGADGTPVSIGTSALFDSAAVLSIGGDTTGSASQYAGYLSEVEIYKGEALHTADFTPSSDPFLDAIPSAAENALIYDDITPV